MVNGDNTTAHDSSEYDAAITRTIPFYREIHQEILDVVATITPDVTCWLDTGCGTGAMVEFALSQFPNTNFLLADPSEAMLEQARARFQNILSQRVVLLQPVSSEDVASRIGREKPQVVTAIQCHHYLSPPDRYKAVRSCYHVLGDGGVFIAFENIAPHTERGCQIGLKRWGKFQITQGRTPLSVENHLGRFGVDYFPITIREHLELLHAVGFRVVEVFWLSYLQAGFYAIK